VTFIVQGIFVRTFRKIMLILVMVVVALVAGMFYAPRFLVYSTNYAKVDAIIVLLGPVFNARERHARDLIKKGMADYLIIPAYNKTYYVDQGTIKPLPNKTDKNNINGENNQVVPRYYEDTHLELIEAKKTMKMYGQKSAIFVSSPYHMRRIQLMVDKEFDHHSKSYFSPTPYDPAPLNVWELKAADWKKVQREYGKILWFMIYSLWT
jgi:uncharacterized SAM-binding protein YcdF (DUF218 family)